MKHKNHLQNWIYGKHAVTHAISNPKRKILRCMILKSQLDHFSHILREKKIQYEIANAEFFTSTFGNNIVHQGCAVLASPLEEVFIEDVIADEDDFRPIIVLDQVQDPQNVGAILRTSAVFDARCVVIPSNNSANNSAIINKIASGAIEHIPLITVVNISQTLILLKKNNFWCVGLSENGEKYLHEIDFKIGKYAFVIGNEGDGIRRLTKDSCDFFAKLKTSENFPTLNAAQSAAVALYEYITQK